MKMGMVVMNESIETKETKTKEPSIQSINRAIEILHCFEVKPELSLAEVCAAVKLHKSTVYGILTTLKNNDFLRKDPDTGIYSLGLGLYKLASNVNMDLRRISLPFLQELCNTTSETVNLVIPDGVNVVYVEKCESSSSMRISTNIGTQLPMYCTAVGKAILAYMDPRQASQILDQSRLVPRTEHTIVGKDDLMEVLKNIRRQGYALDMEELDYGLVCIAAPVVNSFRQPVAAVSCSGSIRHINTGTIPAYSEKVMRCALKISQLVS